MSYKELEHTVGDVVLAFEPCGGGIPVPNGVETMAIAGYESRANSGGVLSDREAER